MAIINLLLELLGLVFVIQGAMLLLEVLASLKATPPAPAVAHEIRSAILIPAHNEAASIGRTLASLCDQLDVHDRVLVVADNCTDATASIVRSFADQKGAPIEVTEREHAHDRGKGFALAHGLRVLEQTPPDVVVIVDADCLLEPGSIQRLKVEAWGHDRPIQAHYVIETPEAPSLTNRISAFALIVKNVVRLRGTRALGMPSLLVGAGMAFPWKQLQNIQLASGNIVEDMQMGIDLALLGHAPLYCDAAKVMSVLPEARDTALTQRKRWEHGHLSTLLSQVPRLLVRSVSQRRPVLAAHALDLSIPPLSLLAAGWMLAMLLAALALPLAGSEAAAWLLLFAGLTLFFAIGIAWARYARAVLSVHHLLKIPLYIAWKLPLYLKFLTRRETTWVRTARSDDHDDPPSTPN